MWLHVFHISDVIDIVPFMDEFASLTEILVKFHQPRNVIFFQFFGLKVPTGIIVSELSKGVTSVCNSRVMFAIYLKIRQRNRDNFLLFLLRLIIYSV